MTFVGEHKNELYFSGRHLSSICLACSYRIDFHLLQLQVCCCKANVIRDIKNPKIIFTPLSVLDVPAACMSGNLSIPHIREQSMFRMLVRRVKRTIFGSQREEMTGDWKEYHNEDLYDFYSLPNHIQVVKLREKRCAGHGANVE